MLIHHWWFTGRTRRVNISLIRFSWQARLVYSTIYHIHLRHNITRHNKQSQPSFDYFRVEEKYVSHGLEQKREAFGGGLFSVLRWLERTAIKRARNQMRRHTSGSCGVYAIARWAVVWTRQASPPRQRGLLKYLPLCHLQKTRSRECAINKKQKQKPNYVKV